MREKFEKIPPPLQKQIIMRCGAALVSLLLMVVSLLLEGNLYLSLSVLLFFAFMGSVHCNCCIAQSPIK